MKKLFIWELPYEKSYGDPILDRVYVVVADSTEEARKMALAFALEEYEDDHEMIAIAQRSLDREPEVYEMNVSGVIRPCH